MFLLASTFPQLGRRSWVSNMQFYMKHGLNARYQVWDFASVRVFWDWMLESWPSLGAPDGNLEVPRRVWGHSLEKPHLHNANRCLISKPNNNIVLELYSVAFCFSKTTLSWKGFNWQGNNMLLPRFTQSWHFSQRYRVIELGMSLCRHQEWAREVFSSTALLSHPVLVSAVPAQALVGKPGGCLVQESGPSSQQLRKVTWMPILFHPAIQMKHREESATIFLLLFLLFFRNCNKKVWLSC